MTRSRSLVLALTAFLLAGVLAACGSSSSGSSTPSAASSSAPTGASTGADTVVIKNFTFTPATLTVKAGTKVTFIQEDGSVQHNVTSTGSGAKTIKSPNLNKGQSYTITFTKAGTYAYTCTIHPFMKGTVIVT